MKTSRFLLALALALSVSACDQAKSMFGKSGSAAETVSPPAANPASPAAALPDVGKVGSVTVNAKGTGASAAEAIDEAMRLALKQVNGTTMDMSSEQLKLTLTLSHGKNVEALRGTAFAEHIVQSAGGAITGFKVNAIDGPDSRGFYKADIEASVAKFTPSAADSKKLKIVIAPLRFDTASFPVGGRSMPSEKVAEDLRQHILAALTNTGRFTVLDRDMGGDVAQELDMISSGSAPMAEIGKLGQAMSVDVIWVGKISEGMQNDIANRIVSGIISRDFPVTVISREGSAVVC